MTFGTPAERNGTNENVGYVVKQLAETTGDDLQPDHASILEKGVRNKEDKLFLESLHSLLDNNCK